MLYVHHVIEDMERYRANYIKSRPPSVPESLANNTHSRIIQNIKNAIKYKFGTFQNLLDIYSQESLKDFFGPANRTVFMTKTEDLYFPYELCWFEWAQENPLKNNELAKHGILTQYVHERRLFQAFFFGCAPEGTNNTWIMEPLSVDVGIGHLISENKDNNIVPMQLYGAGDIDLSPDRVNAIIFLPLVFLVMALNLLNCVNIGTVDNYPPDKLQKKRARNKNPPLYRYKTLILVPVGKRQKSLEAQGLWENALHITKGLFKYYPPPGLFGKYPGRFWFQPHVRGSKKKGVLHKHYDARKLTEKAPLN